MNDFAASLNHLELLQALRDCGIEFIGADKSLLDEYGAELAIFEQIQIEAAAVTPDDEVRQRELSAKLSEQQKKVLELHRRVVAKVLPLVRAITGKAN